MVLIAQVTVGRNEMTNKLGAKGLTKIKKEEFRIRKKSEDQTKKDGLAVAQAGKTGTENRTVFLPRAVKGDLVVLPVRVKIGNP